MVRLLKWAARLWSVASIVLIIKLVVGQGFNPGLMRGVDWLKFFFFPVGAVIGMLYGWRKEALGGSLIIFSFAALAIVNFIETRICLPRIYLLLVLVPGILFLAAWFFTREQRTI
ncbi:MAG: hypothetical protein JXB45_10190 [Candidatus Krumholzibacteriota bacterium]|nr:hypothetical protein [Candidatus Krumholzibacteriota bacterium]